jgi:tRNA threonylcarbamoyladenosine biosynthesis protein TsaB
VNLLAIDTSTDSCSVAASRGEALFSRSEPALQRQAERVLGMVEALLEEAQLGLDQIEGTPTARACCSPACASRPA